MSATRKCVAKDARPRGHALLRWRDAMAGRSAAPGISVLSIVDVPGEFRHVTAKPPQTVLFLAKDQIPSCLWCGRECPKLEKTGRPRRYCGPPCKQRAYELRRLASALGLTPETQCDAVEPLRVYWRDKWRCGLCHEKVDRALRYPNPLCASLDHVIPLSRGGTHTYANVQCAHLRCNVLKNNGGSGEQLAMI
jgi:5-methylcytosine-specific restriction endonuclease McrA